MKLIDIFEMGQQREMFGGYVVKATVDDETQYGTGESGYSSLGDKNEAKVFYDWKQAVSHGKDVVDHVADLADESLYDEEDETEVWTSTSTGGNFKNGPETVDIYYNSKNDSEEFAEITIEKV